MEMEGEEEESADEIIVERDPDVFIKT